MPEAPTWGQRAACRAVLAVYAAMWGVFIWKVAQATGAWSSGVAAFAAITAVVRPRPSWRDVRALAAGRWP